MERDLRRVRESGSPSVCSLGAALGLVGGIGSAVVGATSASDAANATTQAANTAAQTQLQMYNQTRQDLTPWMTTGQSANSQLANLYGLGSGGSGVPNSAAMLSALTATPGYQFGLQQGQNALDHSAASQGLLLSGSQLAAAQAYGTGYAQQNAWQPYVSQLNSMSGVGESAAAGVGQQGATAAANAGSAQLAAGSAQAAGAYNTGTALSSALNQSLYGYQQSGLGNLIGPQDDVFAASSGNF